MRLLAAACALLLTFASTARATTSKPIDRPDGPPEPTPVQVGDPDDGHEIIVILYSHVFVVRLPNLSWATRHARFEKFQTLSHRARSRR
jgi:hypothetical protein